MFVRPQMNVNLHWRERAKQIKAIWDEYNNNASIMTPYEQQLAGRYYAEQKHLHEEAIVNGVIGAWKAGIGELKNALAEVEQARVREINRWQPARLRDEMEVYGMLITQAAGASRGNNAEACKDLQRIYSEAKQSGDVYKQRAAAESMKAVLSSFKGDVTDPGYLGLNRLRAQAVDDLTTIRVSEDLTRAHQKAEEKVKQLNSLKQDMVFAAESLGYATKEGYLFNSPIQRELEKVHQSNGGSFEFDE